MGGPQAKSDIGAHTAPPPQKLSCAPPFSQAEEPDHVAAEAADLLYFAMVRCAAAGVGLVEIEQHLDRRSLKLKRRSVPRLCTLPPSL